jgi:hypothetical protein
MLRRQGASGRSRTRIRQCFSWIPFGPLNPAIWTATLVILKANRPRMICIRRVLGARTESGNTGSGFVCEYSFALSIKYCRGCQEMSSELGYHFPVKQSPKDMIPAHIHDACPYRKGARSFLSRRNQPGIRLIGIWITRRFRLTRIT